MQSLINCMVFIIGLVMLIRPKCIFEIYLKNAQKEFLNIKSNELINITKKEFLVWGIYCIVASLIVAIFKSVWYIVISFYIIIPFFIYCYCIIPTKRKNNRKHSSEA